jgi:hypothetical protein
MKTLTRTAIAAAVAMTFSAAAAAGMTKDEYQAAKKGVAADYKAAKAACDPMTGNLKDVCVAEAKGREDVAKAQVEVSYKPTAENNRDVRTAKAKAVHAVAKEKCDDQAGNAKDVCVKEADATFTAAKADIKANKQVAEARKDAATDKRDADYAVAKEKCDALAGDAKGACVANAKTQYGKS